MLFEKECETEGLYRPFFKQHVYFSRDLNDMVYQIPKLFPTPTAENQVICVSGVGASKDFSALITDCVPDFAVAVQRPMLPIVLLRRACSCAPSLFDAANENEYIRRDGVSDFILAQARSRYGERVTKEDVFYYSTASCTAPTTAPAFRAT